MYTIKTAKKALKAGIRGYLLKDGEGNYITDEVQRLPFYLEGAPGIGKTQIVSQIAQELGIGFVSFSITHHTRNSIIGLPVIKDLAYGQYTEYTISEIIAKVYEEKEKGYEEGILLLDEFACVSETLMPAMLAFLQTKNIGMYSLPEGWMIVLCGNPPEYNRSARKFDAAILDRMRKLEIEFSFGDFIGYAKEKGFSEAVIEYLELNPADVYYCRQEKGNTELVTCRSWENLGCALNAYEEMEETADLDFIQQFLKYDPIAERFWKFYKILQSGVKQADLDNILEGRNLNWYKQKWQKRGIKYWMSILEHLEKQIEIYANTAKDYERTSSRISNVVRLLEGAKWEKSLREKLFLDINGNDFLLWVMYRARNDEYLEIGKAMYVC